MKQLSEREIQDLLTQQDLPEPPAGLAACIKQEIPDEIFVDPGASESVKPGGPVRLPMSRSRTWLMAASVALAVGGGFFTYHFKDQALSRSEGVALTDHAVPQLDSEQPSTQKARGERADASLQPAPKVAPPSEGSAIVEPLTREVAESKSVKGSQAEAPGSPRDSVVESPPGTVADPRLGVVTDDDAKRAQIHSEQGRVVGQTIARQGSGASSKAREAEREEAVDSLMFPVPEPAGAAAQPPPPPPARRRNLAPMSSTKVNEPVVERLPRRDEAMSEKAMSGFMVELSTGGTAEPNDAPYGDVFFHDSGTNPFIDAEDDALSTFGLDVDTASYTVARRYLRDGHLPPKESVRVEEFINYFDYGDAPPEEDDFAIHAEGAPSIYGQGDRYYLLRFNLSGRELAEEARRPALLTFVVDVSGSMGQENRLGLVKQALGLLLDQLRGDDRIALVTYGSRGQVVLEPTGDHEAIRRAINRLHTGGSTNAEEGLTLAYELAARHRRPQSINRVILCSDGVANVGRTSAGSILERIRREADQGIELTTVGFGMGNYNDEMMERLADDGNGRYAYVDTLEEAQRIFVEDLTGTLQTLAAEARVQVEFNPTIVERYRILGYENRAIADDRFRDDTVDAGEIGVGHKVTALYEVKLARKPARQQKIATLHLRYGSVDQGRIVEQKRIVTGADFVKHWDNASPALRWTSLVAEFAEILKHSYWAKEGDLNDVFRRAQKVSAEFAGDHEAADFVSLISQAAKVWERKEEGTRW